MASTFPTSTAEQMLIGKVISHENSAIVGVKKVSDGVRQIELANGKTITVLKSRVKSMLDATIRTNQAAKIMQSAPLSPHASQFQKMYAARNQQAPRSGK